MTAAAMVSRTNMGFDEVDDVRIAAEEAFIYACDHKRDADIVDMHFELGQRAFEVTVELGDLSQVADEEVERRTAYATFILESVCDSFEMCSDASGTYLKAVKTIPLEPADADS
jgi:serine/threonine-protein kinase RsbW